MYMEGADEKIFHFQKGGYRYQKRERSPLRGQRSEMGPEKNEHELSMFEGTGKEETS